MVKEGLDGGMRAQFIEEATRSIGHANLIRSFPVAEEVMLDHWSGLD